MFEKIWRIIIVQSLPNRLPKAVNSMDRRHVSFSIVIVPLLTNDSPTINVPYQIERLAWRSLNMFASRWWCFPSSWFSKRPLACESIILPNSIVSSPLSVLWHFISSDRHASKKEFGPLYGINGFDRCFRFCDTSDWSFLDVLKSFDNNR